MMIQRSFFAVLALCAFLVLPGCASLPEDQAERQDVSFTADPFEPVNRVVFDVNNFLDRLLLRPLAELYRAMVPPPVRDRVAGILNNMGEPVIFANNILQARLSRAATTFGRFAVNTTAGVGGMFEVADELGWRKQDGDFGQTLHSWGVPSGPYLILPLFGPSTVRAAIGMGVDTMMSPWSYIVAIGTDPVMQAYSTSHKVASALSQREANIENLEALQEGSLDFYAQLRSVYLQHRAKKLGEDLMQSSPVYDDYY